MEKEILEKRLDEISNEFQEQVRLIQSHYEGRAAEIRRMIQEISGGAESDSKEGG